MVTFPDPLAKTGESNKNHEVGFRAADAATVWLVTGDRTYLEHTKTILEKLKPELEYSNVFVDDTIAKISIVGAGMIDRPGIAAKMFRTLASLDINIKMISTSEIKISCLVDQARANDAVEALHTVFGLNCNEVAEVKGDLPDV